MITFKNISLCRGNKLLFKSVNMTFYAQQKIGIIGKNGTGKTSLFAMLLGNLDLDSGSLIFPSGLRFSYVEQEVPRTNRKAIDYVMDADKELRYVEDALQKAQHASDGKRIAELYGLLEDIDGYTANARAKTLLSGLGFAEYQMEKPVNTLSGGWRMRLNLARALMCRSDVLLLDEPTNHLDLDAVIWLEKWLSKYSGMLLLISHDREFLDKSVTHIAHIDQMQITLYSGNYSAFEKHRAETLGLQQKLHEKQQKQRSHLQSYIDRFRVKATKARQAQSRIKALNRMKEIAQAYVDIPFKFNFLEPVSKPHLLLNLEKVVFGYTKQPILQDVDFQIESGMQIGLLGINGAGKSTFIKLLAGDLEPKEGKCERNKGLKVGYFAQYSLDQLFPALSPLDHLKQIDPQAMGQALRNFLGGFNFRGDMALAPVKNFSGGEKARLALALIIWQRPNLLLLDEPTNHLDIEMRQALTFALQSYSGAMVLISHDRHLLKNTVDDLYIVANKKVMHYDGDLEMYQKYLLKTSSDLSIKVSEFVAGKSGGENRKLQRQTAAQHRKNLKPLQDKIKKIETELNKLHLKTEEISKRLSSNAILSDKEKLKVLLFEQAEINKKIKFLEQGWVSVYEELEVRKQE